MSRRARVWRWRAARLSSCTRRSRSRSRSRCQRAPLHAARWERGRAFHAWCAAQVALRSRCAGCGDQPPAFSLRSEQAALSAAKDKIASQQSEIERLGTDLAAALDNVTAARAAAASLDAQRAAAVKSVTKALADKRNAEMAHADALEALQARVAELEARLKT